VAWAHHRQLLGPVEIKPVGAVEARADGLEAFVDPLRTGRGPTVRTGGQHGDAEGNRTHRTEYRI